jgi:hypothetical protein
VNSETHKANTIIICEGTNASCGTTPPPASKPRAMRRPAEIPAFPSPVTHGRGLCRTLVNIGMSLPFPAIGPTLRDRRGHGVDQPDRDAPLGRVTARHSRTRRTSSPGCLPSLLRGRHPRGGRLWTMGEAPNGPVMRACQAHATRGRSPGAPAG